MSRISAVKRAAAAIGILAIPVVGISLIPSQNSASDSSSYSCEGDCKPNPDPTVTRYYTLTVSPTPSATGHAHPSTPATDQPTGACPTITRYVHVPGPTVTRYRYRYISPTATSTP